VPLGLIDERRIQSIVFVDPYSNGKIVMDGKGRDDLCDLTWLCGCETCDMIDDWPLKKGCNVVGSV